MAGRPAELLGEGEPDQGVRCGWFDVLAARDGGEVCIVDVEGV